MDLLQSDPQVMVERGVEAMAVRWPLKRATLGRGLRVVQLLRLCLTDDL
jgi:hypothetical protein